MTASTQQFALNEPPAIARVGQLAVIAGVAGYPLIVAYEELPASLLEDLWDYYTQQLPSDDVIHVLRGADLDQLDSCAESVRLVLVYDGRLLAQVAWRLRVGTKRARRQKSAGPTVFARGVIGAMDDLPSPALAIPGSEADAADLLTWLRRGRPRPSPLQIGAGVVGNVQFPPQIENVLWPDLAECAGPSLLQCDVVRSLLAAICVERITALGEGMAEPPCVSAEDYAAVLAILTRVSARSLEQLNDPLAIAMVGRGNLYLRLRSMVGRLARPARLDAPQAGPLTLPVNDLSRGLTRKDLADLGDRRNHACRRLVEYVQALPADDALKACHTLGLIHPGRLATLRPGAITATWMTANLMSWSAKQVVTHFHPLYEQKLITAHMTAPNGHWVYELPDEMHAPNPLIRGFPEPEDLWPLNANSRPGLSLVLANPTKPG